MSRVAEDLNQRKEDTVASCGSASQLQVPDATRAATCTGLFRLTYLGLPTSDTDTGYVYPVGS